ncbi:hypothetical protein KHA80_13900 [Anaerobacillus sp. HL2]|nr:hypothetical protein KHA80_13900 [Anaerobacillus sp. HL2]
MDANSSPWLLEQGDDHEDDGHHGHSIDHAEAGHHEEYEETGANVPILSTFAAINSGFILYGVIRKYNQKKGLVLK